MKLTHHSFSVIKSVSLFKKIFFSCFILISCFTKVSAQLPTLTLTQWPNTSTTFNYPVLVTNCGDSRTFVVQRNGYIYIVDSLGNKLSPAFLNISALTDYGNYNEEGLLGMAFDPDYKNNGYFYVNYTGSDDNPGPTHIVRYSVSSSDPNLADGSSAFEILKIYQPYVNHNGGMIMFGPDGYLYDFQGDGGSGGDPSNRAQNPDSLLGKILRLDVHGASPYAIPATNMYASGGGRPEIFDLGVRNPWRPSFDRITGDLWIADVGQNAYEEIDFEPAGSNGGYNYGWHCREGLHSYASGAADCNGTIGLTDPIWEYSHSGGFCSISGGYVYRGAQFHDLWGRYLYTDYCAGVIYSLLPAGGGTWNNDTLGSFLTNTYSSFGEDSYGELYVCAHNTNKVFKITTNDCKPNAYILQSSTGGVCEGSPLQALNGIGLSYQWQLNGSDIAGATSYEYLPVNSGVYSVIVTKNGCSDTTATNITIHSLPSVSITSVDTICNTSNSITLTGNPAGGSFSGVGVSGNTFNPDSIGLGDHTISYFYSDSNGCSNSTSKNIFIIDCTGIGNIDAVSSVQIFPVPNKGEFTITIQSVKSQQLVLEIYNSLGQLQMKKRISVVAGKNVSEINMGKAVSGVYRYIIKGNTSLRNGSFVIE